VGNLQQAYDGDRLRGRKTENGVATYYVRSSVLGGQVIAEISPGGTWKRGYVYSGAELLAIQDSGVYWTHQDPVTKSQRVTNASGNVTSAIELDPWGGETNRSSNQAFQPHRFTTYERDANQSDEAMHRRYNRWWSRFDQPDPYDGSYDLTDPQSLNRYAYVQNDPVNFVDPSGLNAADPGSPCSTNGEYINGIIGNDGKCYAGPTGSVTIGGGGGGGIPESLARLMWASMMPSGLGNRGVGDLSGGSIEIGGGGGTQQTPQDRSLSPKRSDKWYGYNNRDFQNWFHRCWKEKGDPDASKEDIEEAYEVWKSRGSPKGGNCWGGDNDRRSAVPQPARPPASANSPADLLRRVFTTPHNILVPSPQQIRLFRDLATAGAVGTALLVVYTLFTLAATPK
jgi:RHS repeat-associated protein